MTSKLGKEFVPKLLSEMQKQMEKEKEGTFVSYSWPILQAAQKLFSVKTLRVTTMLTAPPFFQSVTDQQEVLWDDMEGPMVYSKEQWTESDLVHLENELQQGQDWVVITPELKAGSTRREILEKNGVRVAVGQGKVRRWKGWWRSGTDKVLDLKDNPTSRS